MQQTEIDEKYTRTTEYEEFRISFIRRIHRNGVIKIIFYQETESDSESDEDEINLENRVALEIESGKAIAAFDTSMKELVIARAWIITNDKNDKIINEQKATTRWEQNGPKSAKSLTELDIIWFIYKVANYLT